MDVGVIRKFKFFEKRNLTHCMDPLTKVLNRETMVLYIKNLVKKGTPFSFFILDVDNFKSVNDSFGHQVGDVVLANVAEYLCAKVEGRGVVARYGGDEFLIVFEGINDYKDVWGIGHSINANIGDLRFDGQTWLRITVTMGISRFPIDESSYEGLLKLADKALYRGKTKGRNCFIIYLAEKHKDIEINKEQTKAYSPSNLCASLFGYLTGEGDLQGNIYSLFKNMVTYFMFDHMCIETPDGINLEVVHNLSKQKNLKHIDYESIKSAANNIGLVAIGSINATKQALFSPLIDALKEQEISSTLCCKVSAYGKEYGFIRVDMTNTARMWQPIELALMVVTANTIGMLLHYQGKTLQGFERVEPTFVGLGKNE